MPGRAARCLRGPTPGVRARAVPGTGVSAANACFGSRRCCASRAGASRQRSMPTSAGGRGWKHSCSRYFPALEEIKSALRGGGAGCGRGGAAMLKWFLPARAQIVPQPLGVVGIIVPWNYPLYLSIGPLVGALAAGNRAMLKLSEYTPAFSEWFAAALAERFDPDEVFATSGRCRVRGGVQPPAVRPPGVHRLDRGRQARHGRGCGEPDAADARAWRQVAGDRHRRTIRSSTRSSAS